MENRYFKYLDNNIIKSAFDEFDKGRRSQKIVYHYTSINSFYNILNSKNLYFTSIEEQNDPKELTFGMDIIKYIIRKSCEYRKEILAVIKNTDEYENWSRINNIFIFATSADSDDYSQWIKYGDSGDGLSIGFERIKLINLMAKNLKENTLVYNYPIQYYKEYQNSSKNKINNFENIIAKTIDLIAERNVINKGGFNTRKDFYNLLLIFASLIKDSFHKEEHEWRYMIIADILDDEDDSEIILHRNSLKMIKKVNYEQRSKMFNGSIFNEFILGPKKTYNRNQAVNLYKLLKKYYSDMNIEKIKFSKGIIR